jgi:stress-induced-phosphoprotein 1
VEVHNRLTPVASWQVDELKEKGNAAFLKKDFRRALQLYSEALDLDPSNHLVWANRSASKADLKDYDGAIEDAQQVR